MVKCGVVHPSFLLVRSLIPTPTLLRHLLAATSSKAMKAPPNVNVKFANFRASVSSTPSQKKKKKRSGWSTSTNAAALRHACSLHELSELQVAHVRTLSGSPPPIAAKTQVSTPFLYFLIVHSLTLVRETGCSRC